MGPDDEPLSFAAALAWLHRRLGAPLQVEVSLLSCFFGVGFDSRLLRVESLHDAEAVVLHFAGGQQVELDPRELCSIGHREGVDASCLELQIEGGAVLELSG
jgi:hypothetical protein